MSKLFRAKMKDEENTNLFVRCITGMGLFAVDMGKGE